MASSTNFVVSGFAVGNLTCVSLPMRRFPTPWVEQIPGGYKVLDDNGQSIAYVYGRETKADADIAKVLTMDEARRIASNIAKLPTFLSACPQNHD